MILDRIDTDDDNDGCPDEEDITLTKKCLDTMVMEFQMV